jgi:hypothetical protein
MEIFEKCSTIVALFHRASKGFKGLNHRSFQAKINITKGHAVESEGRRRSVPFFDGDFTA